MVGHGLGLDHHHKSHSYYYQVECGNKNCVASTSVKFIETVWISRAPVVFWYHVEHEKQASQLYSMKTEWEDLETTPTKLGS